MSAIELKDGDYILTEGAAWLEVKGFAVRLYHNGDGLRVSVCESGREYDTLGEVFVFDNELEGDDA